MIKILQYGLTNHLGGIENYLYRLANNIDLTKFQFDFLILGTEQPCFYHELKSLGCNFYFVTPRSHNPQKNKDEISYIMQKNNYDIIQCNLNSLSYITPVELGIKYSVPTIVFSRNAGIIKSRLSNFLHWINFNKIKKDKYIKRIAVSEYAGEWMFGKKNNFEILNNGVDINKFKYSSIDRDIKRKELNIGINQEVIIHTGALREQKNHKFILEVFKEYLKLNIDSKLILVGNGELRDSIVKKINELNIENSVYLLGNRDDIPQLLSMADKYLFPSFYEGFPNALLEAETSGLSALISNTITKEVIINKNCKMLPLEDGSEKWAAELFNLDLNNRESSYKDVAEKGFSVESEVKRTIEIYEDMRKR